MTATYEAIAAWVVARDEARDCDSGYNPNPSTPETRAAYAAAWDAVKVAFDRIPEDAKEVFRRCDV